MLPTTKHWSDWVRDYESQGLPYVIVTMLGVRGSTPRNAGTKMLVANNGFHGTVGGGELEFQAIQRAQAILVDAVEGQWLEHFPLGEKLGQCCGGSTSLLFEHFVPLRSSVYLFGAGHVGRALAPLLATLPCDVQWVDTRTQVFPKTLPSRVTALQPDEPVDIVKQATGGSYFVIMTHQHPLDFTLMEAALRREDAAYIGVIGSRSKWRRFALRLRHRGFSEQAVASVRCPIGLQAVPGKRPAEIAVAVAAELIAHYYEDLAAGPGRVGPSWKQLQTQLDIADSTLKSLSEENTNGSLVKPQ